MSKTHWEMLIIALGLGLVVGLAPTWLAPERTPSAPAPASSTEIVAPAPTLGPLATIPSELGPGLERAWVLQKVDGSGRLLIAWPADGGPPQLHVVGSERRAALVDQRRLASGGLRVRYTLTGPPLATVVVELDLDRGQGRIIDRQP